MHHTQAAVFGAVVRNNSWAVHANGESGTCISIIYNDQVNINKHDISGHAQPAAMHLRHSVKVPTSLSYRGAHNLSLFLNDRLVLQGKNSDIVVPLSALKEVAVGQSRGMLLVWNR